MKVTSQASLSSDKKGVPIMTSKVKGRRKVKAMKKSFMSEELSRFIPPVSRMGGTNPVDWRWGMKVGELRPARLIKKAA